MSKSIERLILVNDSLYWNGSAVEVVRQLTETKEDWSCLYENFEHHYHAQSFVLAFGNRVLNSSAFVEFWARYKPYSSRRHSIDKGEIKLSRKIGQVFGKPICLLSSATVVQKLLSEAEYQFDEIIHSLEINSRVSKEFGSLFTRFKVNTGLSPNAAGRFTTSTDVSRVIELRRIAMAVTRSMECHNPTHFVGLLVNRLFGFPFKRDICQRGECQIADVLRVIVGYSNDEWAIIERDLRAKELPVSMRGVKRVLFDAGRI